MLAQLGYKYITKIIYLNDKEKGKEQKNKLKIGYKKKN